MSRVLFEDLKLPPPPCAVVQCGGGRKRLRANAEVLAQLKHQSVLPGLVLEHRTLSRCVAMADEMVELALGGIRDEAHPGKIMNHGYSEPAQAFARPDAGDLEQMR